MAEHLARIIGTEEDRVNCPFYWKIGACRHGDQCSRSHYKPSSSQTLILRHMYQNPPVGIAIAEGQKVSDDLLDEAADHFESFYSEVFEELSKYGEIEEMVVCDNIGDHIIGNVYVKYIDEEASANAIANLAGRFYAGKQIQVEYTSVTDFREARCRQFVEGQCRRGGYCNFMHMKHVPRSLKRKLYRKMFDEHPDYRSKGSRSMAVRSNREEDEHLESERRGGNRNANSSSYGGERSRNERSYHRRSDRDSNRRERRGHSRNRSKSASSAEDMPPPPRQRQTSEERRAMIAQWNLERDSKTKANSDDPSSEHPNGIENANHSN